MKQYISLSLMLFSFIDVFPQGAWNLSSVIQGSSIEPKYSVIDNQSNIYILSTFSDTIYSPYSLYSYGNRDIFLMKIDSKGDIIWNKRIGSQGIDAAGGITTDNSFIYVTGVFYKNCRFSTTDSLVASGTTGDIFLAKYDLNGTLQWAKKIGSASTYESSLDLKYADEKLIICGAFKDSLIIGSSINDKDTLLTNGVNSNYIAEFNLDGFRNWSKRILGTNTLSRFYKTTIGSDGYYFGGFFQGNLMLDVGTITSYSPTAFDAFLYKTDFDGNGLWVRRFRGQNLENFKSISTDEFDNIYVLGTYSSPTIFIDSTSTIVKTVNGNLGGYDAFIAKYNRSGILQWVLRKGSSSQDTYNDFVVKNSLIFATGYYTTQIVFNNDTLRTSSSNMTDVFMAAFNEIGDPISGVSINGTDIDMVTPIVNAGAIINMDVSSRAYVSGYYRARQVQIGNQIYTSNNFNKSDLFFAIYQHPLKAVITDERSVSCNGLNDGMLTATGYFGRPPYTYSWSHNPSLNSPVAEDLAAGEYTVTITDANDSTASVDAEVFQAPAISISGAITPVTCFNGNDGEVNITVTGGNDGLQYFWTSLDGSGIEPIQEDQAGLSAGTYTVTVEDRNNCSDTSDFVVVEPAQFNYTGTIITNVTTPPGNNGAINLNPSGGNYPYTFVWTGPSGYSNFSEDIGNLATGGLYNLSLTDAKNCTSDTSFLVNDEITLIAQIVAKTDVLCFGGNNGTATVRVTNGTPPFTYDWGPLGIIIDSTQVGMTAGDYIVTVTDSDAKVTSASVSILGPSAGLTTIIDPDDLLCNDDNSGVVDLTVSGGTLPYSYLWSNNYTGEDLVNVPANTYFVTVTDGNGCEAVASTMVDEPDAIGVIIDLQAEIDCHGDRTAIAFADASGGNPPGSYTFQWDDPGTQTTQTAYELEAGSYSVIVTDSNNCSKTATIDILEPDEMTMTIVETAPSCPGTSDGSLAPTVTGGTGSYEYVWSNNHYTRFNTDITAGTYTLVVNDENQCIIYDTIELNDPDTVRINSIDITDVSCFGKTDGVLMIQATGGTGILEFSTDGQAFSPNATISGLPAGDCTVLARDENECESESFSVNITILDTVLIDSVLATDATCVGIHDGSLEIYARGGTGSLEYSIDGGNTFNASSTPSSLTAGDYAVIARDENECISEEVSQVLVYTDTVSLVSVLATDVSCSGLPDGSITITARGGTGTYEYSSDGGSNFSSESFISSLGQGDYTVVARDGNGCLTDNGIVTIHVTEVCDMIIYDAFSPNNGDTKNDVWNIGNVQNFPDIKVTIFNVWGKVVFSSKGYGTPWDGKYEGKDLPAGTYYYIIDPGDGSDFITGDVSIVR